MTSCGRRRKRGDEEEKAKKKGERLGEGRGEGSGGETAAGDSVGAG